MKKLFFTLLVAFFSLITFAQDSWVWKGIEFDLPSGFSVMQNDANEFRGKCHDGNVYFSIVIFEDPNVTIKELEKHVLKMTKDHKLPNVSKKGKLTNGSLTGFYVDAWNDLENAIYCALINGNSPQKLTVLCKYSDGYEDKANEIINSIRAQQ